MPLWECFVLNIAHELRDKSNKRITLNLLSGLGVSCERKNKTLRVYRGKKGSPLWNR